MNGATYMLSSQNLKNILIFAKSICPDISLIRLLLLQKTELPKLLKTCIKKKRHKTSLSIH
ncbi:hypothetical protein PT2222_140032 [Paraburkholderia tropica]